MWPGVAAGLALLTLSLARLAYAQNVTVTDQQLLYDGQGWGTSSSSQACASISQSVHTTSNSGDIVSYSFTGSAVYVHGPGTSGSNPLTVILDGAVQTVLPVTQDNSGCGILYSNPNISSDSTQHRLDMVFSGSSTFSISGITTTGPNNPPSVVSPAPTTATLPRFQAASDVPPLGSTKPTTTLEGLNQPFFTAMDPNAGETGPTAGIAYSSTSSGSKASNTNVIDTSTFVTTPGMTVGVIAAIVGTIVGMIALLIAFVLIRRRITRQTERKRDQQSSFGRGREMEEGKGKGKAPLVDHDLAPAWGVGSKKDGVMPYTLRRDDDEGAIRDAQIALSAAAAPPAAVISGPIPQSATSPVSSARSRKSSEAKSPASMTYTINLGSALSPVRPTLPALLIPSHEKGPQSPPPPGLETAGSSQLSQRTAPPPFSSAATWGGYTDEKAMQSAYVVNRTESTTSGRTGSSARTGAPPPGYI